MVDLVLDDARLEALGVDDELLPRGVVSARANARRALDLDVHAGDAQAALFGCLELVAVPLDDAG